MTTLNVLNGGREVVMKQPWYITVTTTYLRCSIDKVIKNNDSRLSAQKKKLTERRRKMLSEFWKAARWI